MADSTVTYRTCPLCEAGCGLAIETSGGRVTRIRGDRDDVFSQGFLCPKGSALRQLHEDPDRLRRPLVKRGTGHVEMSWEEAWAEVADRLHSVIERSGREAVGVYLGNPTAHHLSAMLHNGPFLRALGTKARFSASTVDQMPKQVACGLLFGTAVSVPVPDLDRTDHLLLLGANPYASNGSLCTAPDFPGRIEAIRARGGKVVVVDPRRSRTAMAADAWLAIRPGTDALLLAAMVTTLFEEGLADAGPHVSAHLRGVDEVRAALAHLRPEAVAQACGIEAPTIRQAARELASAPSAAVYGRIGTTTTAFGTTASWLVDVLNVLTGNLDRPGGAMFPKPAAGSANTRGTAGRGLGLRTGRGRTRVRGLPEVLGEYPVAALAEEIATSGQGQLRALITVAGNPVLSIPGGDRLAAALETLELMVSVDIYLNETTRHAHVILPPPSPLERSHYDVLLLQFAVRNVANYSPAVLPRSADGPDEWEILCKLGLIAQGESADADPAVLDDVAARALAASAVRSAGSPVEGHDADEVYARISDGGRRGPERMLDLMLRTGPYGDGFGARPDGLSLDVLLVRPHGVDLGPLEPRLPEVLRTPSGCIELAPPELIADVARLSALLDAADPAGADPAQPLVLVGRRDLRSNNSWMHNLEVLVKGRPRCTVHVHPDDAARLGITDGALVQVRSASGTIAVAAEVTDAIRPGVVSVPHGWGHDQQGTALGVAGSRPGANVNVLAGVAAIDPLSGTSVLNGIAVELVVIDPSDVASARSDDQDADRRAAGVAGVAGVAGS